MPATKSETVEKVSSAWLGYLDCALFSYPLMPIRMPFVKCQMLRYTSSVHFRLVVHVLSTYHTLRIGILVLEERIRWGVRYAMTCNFPHFSSKLASICLSIHDCDFIPWA